MYLNSTADILRVNVASAADITVLISWGACDDGAPPVVNDFDSDVIDIGSGTGNTTLLTGVNNDILKPTGISIYNDHASSSTVVYVEYEESGPILTKLAEVTLLAGELLLMNESGVWLHYDANGAVYPAIGNAASQAEMEAGTATDKYVTPQALNWHPGACKCWGKANGAGTSLLVNWNVAGITDTATGRLGVTIGTDFSSSNYSIVASLERSVTSLTATGVEDHAIRNASPAVGSFEIESYDQTAILFAAQDPANYFWACFGDQA